MSHTKDGFRWDENEEPFLELLKEHLDSDELPLLRQCESYRSLASKKDRTQAAIKALRRTGDAICEKATEVLPAVADKAPVDTLTEPLVAQRTLAKRELNIDFRGQPWLVRIELSDDPAEGDWLTISDLGTTNGGPDTIEIRVSMAHPFMITFAQTNADDIEPLLRIAAALAIAEKLARRAGVKSAGTIRRNMNEILKGGVVPAMTRSHVRSRWSPTPGEEANGVAERSRIDDAARARLIQSARDILGSGVEPGAGAGAATGLIVGYVQSGKTLSFTTAIGLARDSGFPLVIVVAGNKDNLLTQSHQRLAKDLDVEGGVGLPAWIMEKNLRAQSNQYEQLIRQQSPIGVMNCSMPMKNRHSC